MMDVGSPEALGQLLAAIQARLPAGHDGYFVVNRRRYQSTLQLIKRFADEGEILEIGAAPAHFTALLKAAGYAVVGIDLDPSRLAHIVATFGLDIRRCDVERDKLPFPDHHFGCVVFTEILEHLRIDPLFALAEVNRVLRPNGILILTTPNLYSAQNIARFALGRGLVGDALTEFRKLRQLGHMGHIREYTRTEVKRFLEYSGFVPRHHRFADYSIPNGKRQTAKFVLARLLPNRLLSFHEVVAEKVTAALAEC
jgi:SAM-dependent methyltransferase